MALGTRLHKSKVQKNSFQLINKEGAKPKTRTPNALKNYNVEALTLFGYPKKTQEDPPKKKTNKSY